jgi:hypothetical protein
VAIAISFVLATASWFVVIRKEGWPDTEFHHQGPPTVGDSETLTGGG